MSDSKSPPRKTRIPVGAFNRKNVDLTLQVGCPNLDSDVRFELLDPENGILPLYSPFVRLLENSDFGSTSGTHSESSRRSWKLRFLLHPPLIHARSFFVRINSKFPFVKKLSCRQQNVPKTHKSYRSSRTGYCSGSGPKMRGSPSGPLQHTRISERSAE